MEARLRPHPYLLWRGVAGSIAFIVPTFGVLYLLTVPRGPWVLVLVANAIAVLVVLLYVYAVLHVSIWVSPEGISERGLLPRIKRYPIEEIASLIEVDVFHGGWVDTLPQLLVAGQNGTCLVRMRGQFWSRESMRVVSSTLERPFTEIEQAVSVGELVELYPELLYWHERRPVAAAAAFTGALLVLGVGLYVVLLLVVGAP